MNERNGDHENRRAPSADTTAQRAFFGRRKGHKLRSHQADLIAQLLPRLALDIAGPPMTDLGGLFDMPVDNIRLEIGFGGGEHLIAEARAFPNTGFIGCEPYVNGMAKILALIEAGDISNIRLFAGDASELLALLPAQSLTRIDLIHPDPWPKRRHWKRRFVQDATIAAMARVLKHAAASFALSATSATTAPGRFRISCARPIFSGPRSAHPIGASHGPTTR